MTAGMQFLMLAVGSDIEQQTACARHLEDEMHAVMSARDLNVDSVRVRAVPFTTAAFARTVREPLDVGLPLRLCLPAMAEPREIALVAFPLKLLTPKQMRILSSTSLSFRVMCRLERCGVSAEMLYGVPLLVETGQSASPKTQAAQQLLTEELHARQECLLLNGAICPFTLAATKHDRFFVAFPVGKAKGMALVLRGIAFAEIWSFVTLEANPPAEKISAQCVETPSAKLSDLRAFDPYELRGSCTVSREEVWRF